MDYQRGIMTELEIPFRNSIVTDETLVAPF